MNEDSMDGDWLRKLRSTIPLRLTDPLRSRDLRIGIVGTSRSGKSVLLTSILDHLKNFDPEALQFSRPLKIRRFRELNCPQHPSDLPIFPYESFRGQLTMEARWPAKTKATYHFRCRLEVDDHALLWPRQLRLDWLDFPGERLADIPMGGRDYATWSDHWWESFARSPADQESVVPLTTALKGPEVTLSELSETYRGILARLTLGFRPLVSPSVFLLCPEGTQPPRNATVRDLAARRPIGIRPGDPVIPLPREARERHPRLAEILSQNYRQYVSELASPLFKALARCDRILFAVNIPEILLIGPEALNDTSDLITRFLEAGLPPDNFANRVQAFLRNRILAPALKESWRPGGVERVAFVATQADRVLASDANRLLQLLNQLVATPMRKSAPTMSYRTFTCAAVRAAQTRERKLVAATRPGNDGRDHLETFAVSSLPDRWPDQWSSDDFQYPEVFPRFSPVRHRPPLQEGLSSILEYLLLP